MTDPQPLPPEPAAPSPVPDAQPSSPAAVVRRLVREIRQELWSPGEVATLRRLDPDEPEGAAFWKVIVDRVEPAGQVRGSDGERRWALILRSVAEIHELHQDDRRLGRALAAAGVSEMRLARLLRADVEGLSAALRAVVHQLASAAEKVDLGDLAWLVITARGAVASSLAAHPREDATRRRIARDYYRGLRQATEDSSTA